MTPVSAVAVRLITSLPVYTQHLLVLLFGTFRVIATNAERARTGMTSEALGVSVAPSFFQSCVSDGREARQEDVQRFKVGAARGAGGGGRRRRLEQGAREEVGGGGLLRGRGSLSLLVHTAVSGAHVSALNRELVCDFSPRRGSPRAAAAPLAWRPRRRRRTVARRGCPPPRPELTPPSPLSPPDTRAISRRR